MKCGHCRGSHATSAEVRKCGGGKNQTNKAGNATATYDFLSMGQQVFLRDLLRQLHLELEGGVSPETVSYLSGKEILDALIDVRRNKATGKPWKLPAGVRPLANPPSARQSRRPTLRKPMPDVPAGFYAVPSLTGDLRNDIDFFRVKRPESGQWAGRVFVDEIIGGRPERGLPDGTSARQVLEAIMEFGVEPAGVLYATKLKNCRNCGIHLTRKASRVILYGPDCADEKGLGAEWRELDNAYGHALAEEDE